MKKRKKKIIKKIKKLLAWRPEERDVVNFLYIFLIAISIIYGALIYGWGVKIKGEPIYLVEPQNRQPEWNREIRTMVGNSPMKSMVSYVSRRDKRVATFLVAIAKKESNWGKFSPKKNGRDCYNYWGYRGTYNQTASGYSCFDSPRQAVSVVGNRIQELINKDIDTPKEMAVWKCGYDCSWDNPRAVQDWISSVDTYYQKLN